MLVLLSCGDGVPSATPVTTGPTCQTNSDCATNSICVNSACIPLFGVATPDAGSDAGSMDTTPDSGPAQDYGSYCQACTSDSDCGGNGALCLNVDGASAYCGYPCSNAGESTGCPPNGTCYAISGASSDNCFPTSGTCGGTVVPDAGTTTGGHDAGTTGGHDAGTTGGHDAGMTTTPDAGPCTTETWSNTWDSWFSSTCFSCHQHTGETKSWASGSQAYSYMASGRMPQGGPTVSASQLAAIQQWDNCGAP
jgi:hypothetical protein